MLLMIEKNNANPTASAFIRYPVQSLAFIGN
jgi:hypothetical protein